MNTSNYIDGDSWENDVKRWLRLRYPNDFQAVPALDDGDAGIEGFTLEDRNVYQCYAALSSLDTRSLYENQRDKLTEDIGKFVANKAKLLKVLPPGFRTRRYIFVVPEFRSRELIAHAQRKTEEVIAASLPYVDDGFAVIVHDRSNYEVEQRSEIALLLKNLNVEIEDVAEQEVESWASDNNDGVKNLERKIPLFSGHARPEDIKQARTYWIERKICTDNALEKLRSRSPEAWERIWGVKIGRERLLGRVHSQFGATGETVAQISDRVVSDMLEQVPNLAKIGAETLAEGLVGEWLQNCKLNFRASST